MIKDAIIISDLHIGAANCQAKLLVDFLKTVKHFDTKRLILNGDVFENFDSRLTKWHWKVLSAIKKVSDVIEVIWTRGNHDAYGPASSIAHLIGAKYLEEYSFKSGGKSILCVHGDKFDNFITNHPIITYWSDVAYWLLKKIDGSFYLAQLVKHNSKTFLRCVEKVKEGAIKLSKSTNHQIIITGHTHYPEKCDGDIEYLNSGSWTELPCHYVIVENGETSLKTYIDV